jgi:hypothetical protein
MLFNMHRFFAHADGIAARDSACVGAGVAVNSPAVAETGVRS